MVSNQIFSKLALSFPECREVPHFDKKSFRVRNKIFTTLDVQVSRGMVKLSLVDQSVFCSIDPSMIYPVPGGWGKQGATFINLKLVSVTILKDALWRAYVNVAPLSLRNQLEQE